VTESGRPRIVVVDDDPEVRGLVGAALEADGFDVRVAGDGAAGVALARAWRPDAIVLDVVMPTLGGLDAIAHFRRFTAVPIVLMSVRGAARDRVVGLEAGADDYLPKPISLAELSARLRSALRRPPPDRSDVVRFADLELDVGLRAAFRGARRIELSTREYTLLATLIRQPQRVFTRGELLDLVWGAERDVNANTLETYISYLRAKVNKPPCVRLIHTVRGIGYRLALAE
jgi:two-component system response regulator MprA